MTRAWGAWTTTSGGVRFRLGVDYTTGGTNITVNNYVAESSGWVQNNITLVRSGISSGSIKWYFNRSSAGVSIIPKSGFSFTGTMGKTYTIGGRLTNMVYGHTPSISLNVTLFTGVPSAPRTPSVSNVGGRALTLSWSPPSSNGGSSVIDYAVRVYRGSNTSSTPNVTYGIKSRSLRITTGLLPNTRYTFTVLARNANGYSMASPSRSVTTTAGLPTAPGRPTASNITSTSARLGWSAPSNNGGSSVRDYQMQRFVGKSAAGTPQATTTHTGAVTVSGLTPGKNYTFRVRARNINGYGPWSTARTIVMKNITWVKVSGVWRQAVPYVKHNGKWKEATAMVKHNGKWRATG